MTRSVPAAEARRRPAVRRGKAWPGSTRGSCLRSAPRRDWDEDCGDGSAAVCLRIFGRRCAFSPCIFVRISCAFVRRNAPPATTTHSPLASVNAQARRGGLDRPPPEIPPAHRPLESQQPGARSRRSCCSRTPPPRQWFCGLTWRPLEAFCRRRDVGDVCRVEALLRPYTRQGEQL
jgi:hypothetical protein